MIKYSLSKNLSNPLPLNGSTFQAGTKMYPFYEPFVNTEAPYSGFIDGVKVGNNESQPPIEINNNNGILPTTGTHTLDVRNKNGVVLESATFTVGTIVEPPPTNPNFKTITLKLISDNSEVAKIVYDETKVERVG